MSNYLMQQIVANLNAASSNGILFYTSYTVHPKTRHTIFLSIVLRQGNLRTITLNHENSKMIRSQTFAVF